MPRARGEHSHLEPFVSRLLPVLAAVYATSLLTGCDRKQPRPPENVHVAHEAYVWQRTYTPAVQKAIAEHGTNFQRLVALAAEVTWQGATPSVTRAKMSYVTLRTNRVPVGLALRIGPCAPGVLKDSRSAAYLGALAQEILKEAAAADLKPVELQMDFDCAESRLADYRKWVEEIRQRASPIPVTITALPAWLDKAAFGQLAKASDGFVLQVHSLERPKNFEDPVQLCDPTLALRAASKASRFSRPFRVALPTYSYLLAFGTNNRFLGLSAEGPGRNWPPDARVRELRSDPIAIANLLANWRSNTPPWMTGVIWYRFPCADDTLNWRWPTLRAMVEARLPRKSFRAESRRVEPELRDVVLVNDGELDISSRLVIKVSCENGRVVAGDSLRGFEAPERIAKGMVFRSRGVTTLRAGEAHTAAWIRLDQDREVKIEFGEL